MALSVRAVLRGNWPHCAPSSLRTKRHHPMGRNGSSGQRFWHQTPNSGPLSPYPCQASQQVRTKHTSVRLGIVLCSSAHRNPSSGHGSVTHDVLCAHLTGLMTAAAVERLCVGYKFLHTMVKYVTDSILQGTVISTHAITIYSLLLGTCTGTLRRSMWG